MTVGQDDNLKVTGAPFKPNETVAATRPDNWMRAALLFDRVIVHKWNPNAPIEIPLSIGFSLPEAEEEVSEHVFEVFSGISGGASGHMGSKTGEFVYHVDPPRSFDVGFLNLLVDVYSENGVPVVPIYSSQEDMAAAERLKQQRKSETGASVDATASSIDLQASLQTGYQALLENVPIVSTDHAEWDQILDFRNDEEALRKYRDLRLWIRDSLRADSVEHARDLIAQKLDDYSWGLKKHGFKTVTGAIAQVFGWKNAMVAGATAIVAKAAGPVWAAIVGGLLFTAQAGAQIVEHVVDRKDAKRSENREVAIIYEIQRKFGGRNRHST